MNKPRAVVIRRAILTDLPSIVHFNTALARETEHRSLDARILHSGVQALLQDPAKGWYAVAQKSPENNPLAIIGQILVTFEWSDWRNGNFWWLQSVYVHPDHRQQGIFRQFYEYVLAQAQTDHREPICGIRLYVEEHNHHAQEAYVSLGFQKTRYHMYEKALP